MKKNRFSSKPPIDRHSISNPSTEDYKLMFIHQEKINEKLLTENLELKQVNSHLNSELTNYEIKIKKLNDEIDNLKKKLSNYEIYNVSKHSNEKQISNDGKKEKIRSFLEEKKAHRKIDQISDSTSIKGILNIQLFFSLIFPFSTA